MVSSMNKLIWSEEIEQKLIVLVKDWLRQIGKTQSDLCQSLNLPSSKMSILIDFLKKDFVSGGMPQIAFRLCEVENVLLQNEGESLNKKIKLDSNCQLDLLDEICEDLSKINFNN